MSKLGRFSRHIGFAAAISLFGAGAAAHPAPPVAANAFGRATVMADAERLARWQLDKLAAESLPSEDARSWQQAVLWVGMAAFADDGAPSWAGKAVLDRALGNGWMPGARRYSADDQLIGDVYLWAARHGAGQAAITPLRASFDAILKNPSRAHLALYLGPQGYAAYSKAECLQRWCWSDALFMAPSVWLTLSRQTGDRRYRDFALSEFWDSTNFLYDPAERLYFRDSRFFDLRDTAGRKIFWSRGNGWAFAGIARMLMALPAKDPARKPLEDLFRDMAGRLKGLQKPDGYWPSALLETGPTPPETSGTALITYGFAWGVGHGILKRADYEPSIRLGWTALESAIQPDGRLGWVQRAGDRPAGSAASDTQQYGVGLFLLAATAVADLDLSRTR